MQTAPSIQNNDSRENYSAKFLHTIVAANHVATDLGVASKMDQPTAEVLAEAEAMMKSILKLKADGLTGDEARKRVREARMEAFDLERRQMRDELESIQAIPSGDERRVAQRAFGQKIEAIQQRTEAIKAALDLAMAKTLEEEIAAKERS